MRIEADVDKCVGSGQCVLASPAEFDQSDDDGTVVVRVETVPEGDVADVRAAVALCPSQALALRE